MKTKSTDIIKKRDDLSKTITRIWDILYSENKVENGYKRNYEMRNLLGKIIDLSHERIATKLDSLCINLGFTNRKMLPKESIFPIIYELSEKTELFVKLGKLPTIDPNIKRKKGKKKLAYNEEITFDYVQNYRNKLQIEINNLRKQLDDFNEKMEFDTGTAYMYLVA